MPNHPPLLDQPSRILLAELAKVPALRTLARTLGITKSTVSRRIIDLEERLGHELFLRRGRSLRLTAFGEQLTARAVAAQQSLDALELAASSSSDDRLTVAMAPLFAELALEKVLKLFAARRSGVRTDVRLSHAYSDLFNERVDVALRRGPLRDSTSLKARRLGTLTMLCVATPALAKAQATHLTLQARATSLPWIRVGVGLEPFILPLVVKGRRSELALMPQIAVDSQPLAIALAENGLGATRVNAFAARSALERGALVEVLTEARQAESAWVVSPATRHRRPVVRDFIACLLEVAEGLTVWG